MEEHNDIDVFQLAVEMEQLVRRGFLVFVKWDCEKCGERVTCEQPNKIFTEGYTHTEKKDGTPCGHTSFPAKFGMMVMGVMAYGKD